MARDSRGMSQIGLDALGYYSQHSQITDPLHHAERLADLPLEVADLCRVVQGLLIHVLEVHRYGVTVSDDRRREVWIGRVPGILDRILELDAQPITVARPPERRLVATCHDFSVLLCAMLRQQGRPARPRVGFATYLFPGMYSDHWVAEYWEPSQLRWVRVDAQLDGVHRQTYGIDFDACDLPGEAFVTAARAWQRYRSGGMDPHRIGFSRWNGAGYVRHSLLRDFLALNKVELLPWTGAGLPEKEEATVTERELIALDGIAELAVSGNGAFSALRAAYEEVRRQGSLPDWQPWSMEEVVDEWRRWRGRWAVNAGGLSGGGSDLLWREEKQ